MNAALHVGLLINPLAGLGGSLARKGSDGEEMRRLAADMPVEERQRAKVRTERALQALGDALGDVRFSTWAGAMGEDALRDLAVDAEILGHAGAGLSGPDDTRRAARGLRDAGVDLVLFAGGDGTARDIYDALGEHTPVLGIPAGVKMHSAVFAVSPEAAGELLASLARGGLVGLRLQEVRDIDETAFRRGTVRSRYYGQMQVPGEGRFLQHTKIGGREDEQLVAEDIAAWVVENLDPQTTYLVGPGSTTAAIKAQLGGDYTLLGVDVYRDGEQLAADADEQTLLGLLREAPGPAQIIVTVIGGQGHLFGRGNQQFSPQVIRAVGLQRIVVVAGKGKIAGLEGRPLLVDTNDPELDRDLCAFRQVITGYDDHILYRVAAGEAGAEEMP